MSMVDMDWYTGDFIPTVQQRGAAIIEARGASSVASQQMLPLIICRDWAWGGDTVLSMGVYSDGSYGGCRGSDLLLPSDVQRR